MCIALPFQQADKTQQSKIWKKISSSPLLMLGLSATIQLLILIFYWQASFFNTLDKHYFITQILFFSTLPMLFYALLMHFYPKWLGNSKIEFLNYALYFYIGSFNFILILLANNFSLLLLNMLLIFQLIIIAYAFKPIKNLSIWARKKDKNLTLLIHYISALYWLSCLFILIFRPW